jgi:hypothetical protein
MKTPRVAFLLFVLAPFVHAGLTLSLQEIGSDVSLTGSGIVDTNSLTFEGNASWSGSVAPSAAWAFVGVSNGVSVFAVPSAPANIGPGTAITFANSDSGDVLGLFGPHLYLPFNYVSGSSVSGTSIFTNQSFTSLGVTPGVYTWSWGSGLTADSATLTIGGAAIPEPGTLALLAGTATFGIAAAQRFRRHGTRRDGVVTV